MVLRRFSILRITFEKEKKKIGRKCVECFADSSPKFQRNHSRGIVSVIHPDGGNSRTAVAVFKYAWQEVTLVSPQGLGS